MFREKTVKFLSSAWREALSAYSRDRPNYRETRGRKERVRGRERKKGRRCLDKIPLCRLNGILSLSFCFLPFCPLGVPGEPSCRLLSRTFISPPREDKGDFFISPRLDIRRSLFRIYHLLLARPAVSCRDISHPLSFSNLLLSSPCSCRNPSRAKPKKKIANPQMDARL